jgi:transposase-like protein
LRREGLYSSHLVEWRRARDAGALAGLRERPRPTKRTPEQIEVERLRARAERAEAELAKTKAALDVVGKAHALSGHGSVSGPACGQRLTWVEPQFSREQLRRERLQPGTTPIRGASRSTVPRAS